MFIKPNFQRYVAGVDDAALAAGISAAGSVIGAGASAVGQSSLNKKTREFNREEAEKQRLWSEEMWNKQNAWNYEMWQAQNDYNSPAAQIQRLRDAGLNPLFYGLDGSSAGDLSAAQPLGYERAQMSTMANPMASFQDVATRVAQIANIQADTAKKNNENLTETQRREKLIADIEVAKQELFNRRAEEGLTNAQRERIDKDIAWLDRLNEATLAEKEANAALSKSQKKRIDELLEGEKLIQSKTIEDFEHKWSKISAEIAKMAKETGLLAKDIENYALNHASNGFMGSGLSIQNLLRAGKNVRPRVGEENKFSEGTDAMDLARSGQ